MLNRHGPLTLIEVTTSTQASYSTAVPNQNLESASDEIFQEKEKKHFISY